MSHNGSKGSKTRVSPEDVGIPAYLLEDLHASRWGSVRVSIHYIVNDASRHKRAWLVGVCTVFIVVFFLTLLLNAVQRSPYIFLRLSEYSVGEMDLVLTPQPSNASTTGFLNHTYVASALGSVDVVSGVAPRWVFPIRLSNKYDPTKNTTTLALLADTAHEESIHLGRAFPYRKLGYAECHVTESLLRGMGVGPNYGNRLLMTISPTDILSIITSASADSGASGGNGTSPSTSFLTDPAAARAFLSSFGLNFSAPITLNISAFQSLINQQLGQLGGNGTSILSLLNISLTFGVSTVTLSGEQVFDLLFPVFQQIIANGLTLELVVVDSVSSPVGKWPAAIGNVVFLDSTFITRQLGETIRDTLERNLATQLLLTPAQISSVQSTVTSFPINEYAFTSVVMYRDRIAAYVKDEKPRDSDLIGFSNEASFALGPLFTAQYTFPIAAALKATTFIRMFLDQLFYLVVVLMIFLGSLLIYALLLANVEEKTYEYAMLRALGLSKRSLLMIMMGHAFAFAIPGVSLGLLFAFLANIPVALYLADFAATDPDFSLSWQAICLGLAVGILIPIFANIIPIRRAFSHSLRDALDVTHQQFSETSVTMQKLEELGIEPWQTALGIVLVIFGIIVYYLIPYSFTFQDWPLFFTILNAILLGMLLGLCLLVQPFEVYLERAFLWIFLIATFCNPDKKMHTLVKKSMAGHRPRSGKTALMFTVALAFIIFAGVIFSLQAKSIPMSTEAALGSDVVVQARTRTVPLDRNRLKSLFDSPSTSSAVRKYSFVTFELSLIENLRVARLSNLVGFPTSRTFVYGVEKDYLESAYARYFLVSQLQSSFSYPDVDGVPDVPRVMIETAGQARFDGENVYGDTYYPPVVINSFDPSMYPNITFDNPFKTAYLEYVDNIISEATRDFQSIDVNTPLRLYVSGKAGQDSSAETTGSEVFMAKARAMVYKSPGILGFSSYAISVFLAPELVSTDSFLRMEQRVISLVRNLDSVRREGNIPDIPTAPTYQRAFVRLHGGLSKTDRQDLVNAIRNYVDTDRTDVIDVIDQVEQTKMATDAIIIFFNVVAVIASVLLFFILWLSFIANVRENSWEFGVLRSLGLAVYALIRAYIYEALVLILSSVVLGSFIGILIAITLSLQFNLFLELPFVFDFPFALFFSIFGLSIVIALVGSYLPSRKLKAQQIAYVIRGL
eukprot:ANDGO_02681.mRNA.1 FtsX domain-containing protein